MHICMNVAIPFWINLCIGVCAHTKTTPIPIVFMQINNYGSLNLKKSVLIVLNFHFECFFLSVNCVIVFESRSFLCMFWTMWTIASSNVCSLWCLDIDIWLKRRLFYDSIQKNTRTTLLMRRYSIIQFVYCPAQLYQSTFPNMQFKCRCIRCRYTKISDLSDRWMDGLRCTCTNIVQL